MKLIQELKGILTDEKRVLDIIVTELDQLKKTYGDVRRTQFMEDQVEFEAEDLITQEDMVVTVTYSGYIKRLPVTTYRSQKRGGKGVIGAGTKAEDFIWDIFVASTHDHILCFTDRGRVYWLKVHKIPEAGRAAKGKPLINLLNISTHERIQAVLPVKQFKETEYAVMVTKNGMIKKTSLMSFSRPMKKGIIALGVEEGDSVIDAKVTTGTNHIVLVTKHGQSIRFEEQEVREMGRAAKGVIGIRMDQGDEVIGMEIINAQDPNAMILTVTEKGYGKRTGMEEYRVQGRGGSGIMTMRITEKNGPVVAVRQVVAEDEIIVASDHGKIIRTKVSEISEVGRVAQGVRLIQLQEGETVGAVAKIVEKDEDEKEDNTIVPGPVGNA